MSEMPRESEVPPRACAGCGNPIEPGRETSMSDDDTIFLKKKVGLMGFFDVEDIAGTSC